MLVGTHFSQSTCAVAPDATDCPAVETPVKEVPTTSGPKPTPKLGSRVRLAIGAILVLAFFGSIGWIVLGWPLPIRLWVGLALVAFAAATGFIGLFIKNDLPAHWRRALAGGSALTLGIAAVMAVPALQEEPDSTSGPAGSETTSSTGLEPLTLTVKFASGCEDFTIPRSLMPSLPKHSNGLDAKWVYEQGGASLSDIELTIEGKTEHAVVINRMRVVDLKRNPPPSDAVGILSCGGSGGSVYPRFFEADMSDPPKVISRKSPYQGGGEIVKLPVKVSNSDPEVFVLSPGGPECFCEWRLAIDWISGGRSGTSIVNHPFGRFVSDTKDYGDREVYWFYNGKWQQ
jgi:hypothetical protein